MRKAQQARGNARRSTVSSLSHLLIDPPSVVNISMLGCGTRDMPRRVDAAELTALLGSASHTVARGNFGECRPVEAPE